MVPILRRCKPQNRLQQPVDVSRGAQIHSPYHQGDALERVVERGAEMIACRGVPSAEHHVPETFRFCPDFPQIRAIRFGLAKSERTGARDGLGHVEAERKGRAGRPALGRKNRIEPATGSRIDHGLAFMWGARGGGDVLAAAETGIDETVGFQAFEGGGVIGEAIGLPTHRLFPVEAEPVEVVEDRALEFRLAARAVDVLDAEQEAAVSGAGRAMAEQRGMGMAEMEKTCRTGRESRNYAGSEGEGHGGQE